MPGLQCSTTYAVTMTAKQGELEAAGGTITFTTPWSGPGIHVGRRFLKDLMCEQGKPGTFFISPAPGTYEEDDKYVLNWPRECGIPSAAASGGHEQFPGIWLTENIFTVNACQHSAGLFLDAKRAYPCFTRPLEHPQPWAWSIVFNNEEGTKDLYHRLWYKDLPDDRAELSEQEMADLVTFIEENAESHFPQNGEFDPWVDEEDEGEGEGRRNRHHLRAR